LSHVPSPFLSLFYWLYFFFSWGLVFCPGPAWLMHSWKHCLAPTCLACWLRLGLAQAGLKTQSLHLHLPSTWDYRCEPLCPAIFIFLCPYNDTCNILLFTATQTSGTSSVIILISKYFIFPFQY
jgi:hypothetical protein